MGIQTAHGQLRVPVRGSRGRYALGKEEEYTALTVLYLVTTLQQIKLQIATEEFICTGDGVEVEREHSSGAFITMGLDVEDVQ
jgi:hypothetical protein